MKKEGSSCLHYIVTDFPAEVVDIFQRRISQRREENLRVVWSLLLLPPPPLPPLPLLFFFIARAHNGIASKEIHGEEGTLNSQVRWYLPPDIWLVCPTSCVTYVSRRVTLAIFLTNDGTFPADSIGIWIVSPNDSQLNTVIVIFSRFFKFVVLNSYFNGHLWLWHHARDYLNNYCNRLLGTRRVIIWPVITS